MEMPHYGVADGGPVIHLQCESASGIRSRDLSSSHQGVDDCSNREALESAKIFVRAVRGKNLAASDESFFWFWGTSDPFVEVKYKHRQFVSHVASKDLNPEWNMKQIDLGLVDASTAEIIEFNVWDHDNGSSDDFLGCVLVSIGGICRLGRGLHHRTLELGPSPFPEIRPKNKISGCITLQFEVVPVTSNSTGLSTVSPFAQTTGTKV